MVLKSHTVLHKPDFAVRGPSWPHAMPRLASTSLRLNSLACNTLAQCPHTTCLPPPDQASTGSKLMGAAPNPMPAACLEVQATCSQTHATCIPCQSPPLLTPPSALQLAAIAGLSPAVALRLWPSPDQPPINPPPNSPAHATTKSPLLTSLLTPPPGRHHTAPPAG
jgi:hypothetical protein